MTDFFQSCACSEDALMGCFVCNPLIEEDLWIPTDEELAEMNRQHWAEQDAQYGEDFDFDSLEEDWGDYQSSPPSGLLASPIIPLFS